ncbi:MAG TPA: hypothetical protein VM925_10880, partial [Labilithrix sp.]|nr:hypothetical protein [Labilithrix sp.]
APPAPAPNGDTSEPARAAPSQDRPTSDSPKPVEETRVAKVEEAPVVASIDPDEISVPPIGDVAVEGFFSERDLAGRLEAETDDDDALAATDKAKRKADPKVVQRRARFVRYVTWAVAGAAVVCLAAVGRTAVSAVSSTSSVASKQAIVGEAATAAPKAAVPAVAPIAQPSVAPSPSTVATAAESAAPTEAASAAPETASDEIVGDASEEKAKARSLLEKRKIAEAIEAGERSVKLDASDGEAWLILGAAYQEKGNIVEARRAYASCVKEGKTGPRQECAKMLR